MEFFPRYSDAAVRQRSTSRNGPETIKQILVERLEKLGIEISLIPVFIRSLIRSYRINPQMNHMQINRKLQYLGWDDLNLDYHTWQLALACIETDDCTVH